MQGALYRTPPNSLEKQVADWGRVCDEMLQYAARWSKSAHLNARRGICQHYCDLDEILWRCDLDDEAKNTFDKMIKLEYRKFKTFIVHMSISKSKQKFTLI